MANFERRIEHRLGKWAWLGFNARMMMTALRWFLVLAAIGLGACSKPLPADKANYAGEWRSPEMRLIITPGGRVDYERRASGGSKSIQAPIQKFEGNDFVAGLGMLNTRFVVARPPALINGKWTMTVDGVELTKVP